MMSQTASATWSCRTLKFSCKQLEIMASPGFLLKAAGCGVQSAQKTVPLSTEQKVFGTLQDTVPSRITNAIQNQFESIMTSAATMQEV